MRATSSAVAKVAEARDEGTGQHLERISAYTEILAAELLQSPSQFQHP